jgi:DNA-binding transcriptional ArsR family regulator
LTGIFRLGYIDDMKDIWNALAEPNRLRIIELLRDGPLTVGEIVERLEIRQPQVSKHLRVLNEARLVGVQPIANRRIYQLRSQPFQELDHWLQSILRIWDERFDRLDDYLRELQEKEKQQDEK